MGGETIFVPEHHNQNLQMMILDVFSVHRSLGAVAPAREESNVSCLGTPCMTKCTLATVHKLDMVDLHICKEPKVVGGG